MVLEGSVQGQLAPLLWPCGITWWCAGQGRITRITSQEAKGEKHRRMGPAVLTPAGHISEVV